MDSVIGSINAIRNSPEKLRGCILESDLPHFLSSIVAFFMQKSTVKRPPLGLGPARAGRVNRTMAQ
jgi:hypothetical protein